MKSALLFTAAVLGGAAVSFLNYVILLPAVKGENDKKTYLVSPVRSLLAAAYLFLLYYAGGKTSVSVPLLLIGGGLGLTASLAFFTKRLVKAAKRGEARDKIAVEAADETTGEATGETDSENSAKGE